MINHAQVVIDYLIFLQELVYALRVFNYFFTSVFVIESVCKVVALGMRRYIKDKWNQLDMAIVILSIVGIVLEEMEADLIPINPTIMRVMRVMRIARGENNFAHQFPFSSKTFIIEVRYCAFNNNSRVKWKNALRWTTINKYRINYNEILHIDFVQMPSKLSDYRSQNDSSQRRISFLMLKAIKKDCIKYWFVISTVLKLLKMAKGIRSLLDTVMQALPQVGNLGLLFYLLFFIFAALGVELFGRLGKTRMH